MNHQEDSQILIVHDNINYNISTETGKVTCNIIGSLPEPIRSVRDYFKNNNHSSGWTTLRYSCIHNRVDIVKIMLTRPLYGDIDLNYVSDGETILMIACRHMCVDIIDILLRIPDVDINIQDTVTGSTAFHYISNFVQNMNISFDSLLYIVQRFMERKDLLINTQDYEGESPIFTFVHAYDIRILETVLSQNDINFSISNIRNNQTILHYMTNWLIGDKNELVALGHIVHKIHERKQHVVFRMTDNDGKTALILICNNTISYIHYVTLLLPFVDTVGLNAVDNSNMSALMYAFNMAHLDIIQTLLQRKDIEVSGQMLVQAVQITSTDMRDVLHDLLYKFKLDVNSCDMYQKSALMYVYNVPQYADILFKHSNLDINAVDYRGNTALMHACSIGPHDSITPQRISFIKQLLKKGINVNIVNTYGHTALMHLCIQPFRNELIDIVEILCNTTDITIQDTSEYTHTAFDLWMSRVNIGDINTELCTRYISALLPNNNNNNISLTVHFSKLLPLYIKNKPTKCHRYIKNLMYISNIDKPLQKLRNVESELHHRLQEVFDLNEDLFYTSFHYNDDDDDDIKTYILYRNHQIKHIRRLFLEKRRISTILNINEQNPTNGKTLFMVYILSIIDHSNVHILHDETILNDIIACINMFLAWNGMDPFLQDYNTTSLLYYIDSLYKYIELVIGVHDIQKSLQDFTTNAYKMTFVPLYMRNPMLMYHPRSCNKYTNLSQDHHRYIQLHVQKHHSICVPISKIIDGPVYRIMNVEYPVIALSNIISHTVYNTIVGSDEYIGLIFQPDTHILSHNDTDNNIVSVGLYEIYRHDFIIENNAYKYKFYQFVQYA